MKRILTESQGRLLRALIRVLAPPPVDRQFPPIVVESFDSADWASLTFAGQRHRIVLVVPGTIVPALDGLEVAGDIVAEARIVATAAAADCVSLTIAVLMVDGGL